MVREPLFLARAARRAEACPPARRERLRRLADAARARHTAALELRREEVRGAALALEREACALAITALLVARGEHDGDAALSGPEAWARLDRLEGVIAPASVTPARELLADPDPLAPERLVTDPVAVRDAAAATFDWLQAQYEPRSPRQIVMQRRLRLGAVALGALLLVAAGVAWARRPTNVARGRPVLVSSQHPAAPDPQEVVDGSRRGHFGVHTDQDDPPWVEVDLGAVYRVSRVVIVNRGDGYFDEVLPLALQLSEDEHTWQEVAVRHQRFTQWEPWRVSLHQERARYVRVIKPEAGYIALSEIEVYGRR